MLNIKDKRDLLNSFDELSERIDEYGTCHYYFYNSNSSRKLLARHFDSYGNGYIYVEILEDYKDICDDRGWINVKNLPYEEVENIINKIINYHK